MSSMRPSPSEERWLALAARLGADSGDAAYAARTGGWHGVTLPMRCLLFLLGLVAAVTVAGIVFLLRFPAAMLLAGVLLIVTAEALIRSRKLQGCGFEEAGMLAGLLLISFDSMQLFSSYGDLRMACLLAAAFGLAGWRLLNPLMTTAAMLCALYAGRIAWSTQVTAEVWSAAQLSGLCSFGIAGLSLALGARRYQRPAHDRMLSWLVVLLPVAGYVWLSGYNSLQYAHDYRQHHEWRALLVPLAPLLYGSVALLTGLRRRTHAPLLAGMLCVACTAWELRALSGWPYEAKLMFWGCLLLIATVLISRALRTPRGGITSARSSEREGPLDVLQLAGATAISPATTPAAPGYQGGGGQFGGGGASGRY
jgi:hypothetical protein